MTPEIWSEVELKVRTPYAAHLRGFLQPWSGLPVGLPHRHPDGRLERDGRQKLSSGQLLSC